MRKKYARVLLASLLFLFLAVGFWLYTNTQDHVLIIMCAGDSLTAETYPSYLQENLNRARVNAQVVNKGVLGHTSGEYLRYLQSSQVLQEVNPHIVLLQLGTNDVRTDSDHTETAQFITNMNQIIDLIESHRGAHGQRSRILLATIPPLVIDEEHRHVFNKESERRVVKEINPAIKRIAEDRRLQMLDIYQLFQGHPELLPGIHPTQEGSQAMADAWFNQLNLLINPLSVKNHR